MLLLLLLLDECGRPRDRDDDDNVHDGGVTGTGPPGPAVGVHTTDEYHVVASDAAVDHQTSSADDDVDDKKEASVVVGGGSTHVKMPKLASLVDGVAVAAAAVGADPIVVVETLAIRNRPTPRARATGREKRSSGGRCMVFWGGGLFVGQG